MILNNTTEYSLTKNDKDILKRLSEEGVFLKYKPYSSWWFYNDTHQRVRDKTIYKLYILRMVDLKGSVRNKLAYISALGQEAIASASKVHISKEK